MKKPLLAASGAVITVLVSLAPGASAQGDAVRTKVHLDGHVRLQSETTAFFKGKIDSRADACLAGRKIVLRSKADGRTYGTDKTNRDGEFKVLVDGDSPVPSDFKLTATAKKARVGKVRCAEGSDTATLIFPARRPTF